jgi:hypothetical protein
MTHNQRRAARARKALRLYVGLTSPTVRLTGETLELAIVDMMTDMMHVAAASLTKSHQRSFDCMYVSAVNHFQAEKEGKE